MKHMKKAKERIGLNVVQMKKIVRILWEINIVGGDVVSGTKCIASRRALFENYSDERAMWSKMEI